MSKYKKRYATILTEEAIQLVKNYDKYKYYNMTFSSQSQLIDTAIKVFINYLLKKETVGDEMERTLKQKVLDYQNKKQFINGLKKMVKNNKIIPFTTKEVLQILKSYNPPDNLDSLQDEKIVEIMKNEYNKLKKLNKNNT